MADGPKPQKSGHCGAPSLGSTISPRRGSHERCTGGNRARPSKAFQMCPCACHLGVHYECSGCGRLIAEALEVPSPDGEMVYVHVDSNGDALGEEC